MSAAVMRKSVAQPSPQNAVSEIGMLNWVSMGSSKMNQGERAIRANDQENGIAIRLRHTNTHLGAVRSFHAQSVREIVLAEYLSIAFLSLASEFAPNRIGRISPSIRRGCMYVSVADTYPKLDVLIRRGRGRRLAVGEKPKPIQETHEPAIIVSVVTQRDGMRHMVCPKSTTTGGTERPAAPEDPAGSYADNNQCG